MIPPNTITVLPAHQPFRFELASDIPTWTMVWLLLYDNERWQDIHHFSRPAMHFDNCEAMWSSASLIYRDIGGRAAFRQLMICEVVKILSNLDNQLSDTQLRVMSVLNVVESQLHQNWTVSRITAQSYLSEEQIVGMPTCDYVIIMRMRKAVDLLQHKDWSIKMIALRLGYQDPNNFTHRFRKYYGMSPREYRQRYLLVRFIY